MLVVTLLDQDSTDCLQIVYYMPFMFAHVRHNSLTIKNFIIAIIAVLPVCLLDDYSTSSNARVEHFWI